MLWSVIRVIKSTYEKVCDDSLEGDIRKAATGAFERALVLVLKADRSSDFNEELSKEIATKLYNEGQFVTKLIILT